jgi:hypothetical protein
MEPTPLFSKPRHARVVSPDEGQQLIVQQLLATVDAEGDIAAEKAWQAHARTVLQHGHGILQEQGLVALLKMQQLCAEMVLKIRLADRKAPEDREDRLAEFERMMQELFAPEEPDALPVPWAPPAGGAAAEDAVTDADGGADEDA